MYVIIGHGSAVIVEDVIDNKVTQEALLDNDGKWILTPHSILGVPFSSHEVDQICIRLWSSIPDEYNDLANDELYGVFPFVKDEQITEFAKIINIAN
jgi:hypothetical protein